MRYLILTNIQIRLNEIGFQILSNVTSIYNIDYPEINYNC